MSDGVVKQKQVLIIYYSYSGQTRKIITAFAGGLESMGQNVFMQPLRPSIKLPFPLSSVKVMLWKMVETFFRRRMEIEEPEIDTEKQWDLVVLAGPTWSYNPSGPVLRFLDVYGSIFEGKQVLPCISCRAYWRTHFYQLRYMLRRRGAEVLAPAVFLHGGREPWRTVGVFLKIAGRMPESKRSWINRYYPRYGHCREQVDRARDLGELYGRKLKEGDAMTEAEPILIRYTEE